MENQIFVIEHINFVSVDKSHRKMLDFILFRPWLKDFIPEIHTAENCLKELVTHVDTKEEKCMLCSSCIL